MTPTLLKQTFKVENIAVFPFCPKPSQKASFCLNASVLSLSLKIFVQNLRRDILILFKWQNISTTKYAKHSDNTESLSLKTVLFFP